MSTLTVDQASELRARIATYEAWAEQFKGRGGWICIPKGAQPPVQVSNEDRSALEVYNWHASPPTGAYVVYIDAANSQAKTWPGDILGAVTFGPIWTDNMRMRRQQVTVRGTNGRTYTGQWCRDAQDCVRIRETAQSRRNHGSK